MTNRKSRRDFLGLAAGMGTVALAGCQGLVQSGDGPNPAGTPLVGGNGGSDGTGDIKFFFHEPDLEWEYSTFADEAQSGGVGQDGIPSIEDPNFEDVSYGDDAMDPGDPVFGVEVEGNARAYPQYILVRHEIVNDEIGGHNLAVTYCPLTGTAIGFDRGEDEFGVSGMLVNSNLIMYDRSSESWWPQVLGTLVRGEEGADTTGRKLREFRVTWTTWSRWTDVYPDTVVLSEETGDAYSYVADPYGSYNPADGYYASSDLMFSVLHGDDRLHEKEVVIGARTSDGAVAFQKDRLRTENLLTTTVGGVEYVAAYHHGLDSAWVYRTTEEVDLTSQNEGYEAPDGTVYAANALPLEEVNSFDAMWFAWVAFYPNTELVV